MGKRKREGRRERLGRVSHRPGRRASTEIVRFTRGEAEAKAFLGLTAEDQLVLMGERYPGEPREGLLARISMIRVMARDCLARGSAHGLGRDEMFRLADRESEAVARELVQDTLNALQDDGFIEWQETDADNVQISLAPRFAEFAEDVAARDEERCNGIPGPV